MFFLLLAEILEPTIRWSRNNEPVKPGKNLETGHANGEAWLKLSGLSQEDVAEYKCEAINPAGKATTIANLVLKRNTFLNLRQRYKYHFFVPLRSSRYLWLINKTNNKIRLIFAPF